MDVREFLINNKLASLSSQTQLMPLGLGLTEPAQIMFYNSRD